MRKAGNKKVNIKKKISTVIYHSFTIILGAVMIYPILWMIFSSFKENADVFKTATSLLPKRWNFASYVVGWKGFGGISFGTFFKNSFVFAILSTIGMTFSSAFIAFGFSRVRFRGKGFWFVCMILTMLLPAQVLQIPQYVLFQKLHWIDTYLPLIVPSFFGSGFNIFLIMQFMRGIPKDFDESASIDGCSRFMTFWKIILPLVTPALITVAIFMFYGSWDNFMGPLLYINTPRKYPVSLALKMFSDPDAVSDWSAMFAMATLSLVPVFVLFFSMQKYLVDGVTVGGIKG